MTRAAPARCRCCWSPLAADVLLAGLQRHAVRRPPLGVLADADDAARQQAAEVVAWSPGTPRAGRRSPSARRSAGSSRSRCRRPNSPGGVSTVSASRSVATTTRAPAAWALAISARSSWRRAVGGRVLTAARPRRRRRRPRRPAPRARRCGPRCRAGGRGSPPPRGSAGGWRVDHERLALAVVGLDAHVHRLGGGGGLVEQRGVGHRQAGEVGDHRLEVEQRLEAALRDLGLVRRVRGVPAGFSRMLRWITGGVIVS
jgi:hypothetical protein